MYYIFIKSVMWDYSREDDVIIPEACCIASNNLILKIDIICGKKDTVEITNLR